MSKKSPLVASALALAVSSVFAQSTSETTNPRYQLASLDPVVVSASRFEQTLSDVPAFAQVISKEEITQTSASNIAEAVAKLGNINVRSIQGGQLGVLADIDMRGFGSSARDNTLILVDGMRVSPIDSGSIRWEAIPISTVERIEIIHGGGSVQFGDKAVGGVINIITQDGAKRNPTISVTAGSYGTFLTNASLTSVWGDTRAKIDLVADSTDGWRDNSQTWQGATKVFLSHALGGGDRVFVEGSYASQLYHTPGGVIGEVNTGNRKAVKFNNVNEQSINHGSRFLLGISKSFGNDWQFLAETAYSDSQSDQSIPYNRDDGKLSTSGFNIYKKWSYDFTPRLKKIWNDRADTVIGMDYQKASASYQPDTNASRQNAELENKSVYFFHRQEIITRVEMNGGIRRQIQNANAYDNYVKYASNGNSIVSTTITDAKKQQDGNALDLAFAYRLANNGKDKIFYRMNRSYRFANTDEFWGFDSQTYQRSFSGILRPQKSDTIEVGSTLSYGNSFSMTGTLFQIDTKDEIRYNDYDGVNSNFPKTRRQGLSLQLRQQVSKQTVLRTGITAQTSEYKEGSFENYNTGTVSLVGRNVPLTPKLLANIGIIHEASYGLSYRANLSYVASQNYVSGEYDSDGWSSSKLMPSYSILDLGVRYRQKSWDFDLSVKNATDKKYSSYGGYGFVTTSPGSQSNSYYYYPGDPRTLWLSARYHFN